MDSFQELVDELAQKVIRLTDKRNEDLDRDCWMVLHEYHHGVRPSEYDIKEVDEELYLAILKRVRELN
ncbi:hypothetical protein [Prochlorococcus sp. MIT 1223]|uniref:hypothetical protein n=1 Tax=Prochlorococcus sp. MIT 1223 TaxID=3096217 RepID=UPI002A75EC14|nr:hypothetical protein [Prochlorococcus sp. MIT 1223]